MTPALVSVILPVRNRERWVARAIASVLAQTYRPLELIVVDDGSTDNTLRVVREFESQASIVSQAQAGAYAARNTGLRRATGELVAFIDSDDAWLPQRLGIQVPLMARPEVGLVFGDTLHVSGAPGQLAKTGGTSFRVSPPRRGRVAGHFVWGNFVPTVTVLVRRRCFDELGVFPEVARSADYLKWFQVALHYEMDYVSAPVAEYTIHRGGISWNVGESLRARIQLFAEELRRTTDPSARDLIRHVLFNLSLHLGIAAVRGRAGRVSDALRITRQTAASVAGPEARPWMAAFVYHQLRTRTRRYFRGASPAE